MTKWRLPGPITGTFCATTGERIRSRYRSGSISGRVSRTRRRSQARSRLSAIVNRVEKTRAPGFDIRIGGVWRSFRDTLPAAYDAASILRKKNLSAVVTITGATTGAVDTMLEDGRTA